MAEFLNHSVVLESKKGFTPFSSKHLRLSISHYGKGFCSKEMKLEFEDVIVTVVSGKIFLFSGEIRHELNLLDQVLLCVGETFLFESIDDSIVQFIWGPGLYG